MLKRILNFIYKVVVSVDTETNEYWFSIRTDVFVLGALVEHRIESFQYCTLKKDLVETGLGAPIGEDFYHSDKPLPYKWEGDFKFLVYYKDKWLPAYSIDFDF